MADIALNWLRREALVRWHDLTGTVIGPALIAPRDPMRFLVSLRGSSANDLFFGFGNPEDQRYTHFMPMGTNNMDLTEDVYGDVITLPVYVRVPAPGFYTIIMCLSYCPCKWGKYEQLFKSISGL